MTKLEIIQEVLIDTYGANPSLRGVNPNGTCRYTTLDGKHCAVGMCLTKKALEKVGATSSSARSLAHRFGNGDINSMLQKKYQGHDADFWEDLQYFHDSDDNFVATGLSVGLSVEGKAQITYLQEKYA